MLSFPLSRHEKFFTLFSRAGSIVVERTSILIEFVAALHGALQPHARHRGRRRRHHFSRRARSGRRPRQDLGGTPKNWAAATGLSPRLFRPLAQPGQKVHVCLDHCLLLDLCGFRRPRGWSSGHLISRRPLWLSSYTTCVDTNQPNLVSTAQVRPLHSPFGSGERCSCTASQEPSACRRKTMVSLSRAVSSPEFVRCRVLRLCVKTATSP